MKLIKTMLPLALVALSLYACGGPIENDSPVVDTTAPNFIIGDSEPPEGDVAAICYVAAGFDDQILASTITDLSFIIKDSTGTPLSTGDGTWGLSPSSDAIALFEPFAPSAAFVNDTYTVTLTTDITNVAGINLATEQGWTFTITNSGSVACPP